MAFVNQERKAIIAAELKKVMPKDWKYSLSVNHHSTIVLTISAAPIDLVSIYNETAREKYERRFSDKYTPSSYIQVNDYHLDSQFSGELLTTFEAISDALNTGNHDNSDIQSDYFDVGWYVSINIGRYNKPFTVCQSKPEVKAPCTTFHAANEDELVTLIQKHDVFQNHPVITASQPKSDLSNCWAIPQGNC